MNNKLKIRLPTDQLWNKGNAEQRYAELVASTDPNKTYTDENDIPAISFKNEDGEQDSFLTDSKRHQLTNVRGIECTLGDNLTDVYVRGIGLLEDQSGGLQLSPRGKRLREAYTAKDDETNDTDWRCVLAEIVIQRFVRIRTLLFYIGRGLGLSYSGNQLFTGDQMLVNSDITYSIYRTELRNISGTYNGYLTFYGIKSELQPVIDESDKQQSVDWLDKLYGLEYSIVKSAFDSHRFIVSDLERIKHRLFEQVHKDSIDWVKMQDIEQSASDLLSSVSEIPSAELSFERVPNLLLGANLTDILGDEIWIDIESNTEINREDFTEFELRSGSGSAEPLGGNIIATTRHAQRLLDKVGALTDAPEDASADKIPDVTWFRTHLGDEATDDLLPNVLEGTHPPFTEDLKQGIEATATIEGWVKWQELKDNVCAERGISETEFDDKADSLIKDGRLLIKDSKMGIRSSPDGPPGYRNKPKVLIELE